MSLEGRISAAQNHIRHVEPNETIETYRVSLQIIDFCIFFV